jgi:hypothetical protein
VLGHQSEPGSPRRTYLRLSADAAGVFVLGVVLSAVIGGLVIFPYVEEGIARDSKLTPAERRHAAGDLLGLDARQFDSFRAGLRPRQHYSLDVPDGPRFRFYTLGKIARDYGAYYFLPAIKDPAAKRVFHYHFR